MPDSGGLGAHILPQSDSGGFGAHTPHCTHAALTRQQGLEQSHSTLHPCCPNQTVGPSSAHIPRCTPPTLHRPTAHLAVEVAQTAVTFCGPVELGHLGDVETARKVGPDGLAEAVAECHAHPVLVLRLPGRLVQEVAAQLTDVLHDLGAERV